MADTFFGFDTSINHGDNLLGTDELDCIETEEEEYDALNDETFGTLEDDSNLEDWEQQHEQLAEIAESSRHLENSINQLVLDDDDTFPNIGKENTWSYKGSGTARNGEVINTSLLDTIAQKPQNLIQQKPVQPDIKLHNTNIQALTSNKQQPQPIGQQQQLPIGSIPKKICTVEELERGLITPRPQKPIQAPTGNFPNQQPIHHPLFPAQPIPRLPPGLHPMNMPGPPLRNIPPLGLNVPNSFPMMMPYPPGLGPPGQLHPHRLLQHGNTPFPVNHPFNYVQPQQSALPRTAQPAHLQQQQQRSVIPPMPNLPQPSPSQQASRQVNMQQRLIKLDVNSHHPMLKDEYSGLMTNREKQWLLNIQLLQLNTGTPYFDDYYYTVYKSRNKHKAGRDRDNNQENSSDRANRNNFYHHHNNNNNMNGKRTISGNNHGNHHSSRERHDSSSSSNNSILQARVYTPLQFENSLGKLQCGSVTAPRKIIDTDVVTLDNGQEINTAATQQVSSRDTRKTKQILLELEALYALLLKMEDLRNPLAISNVEKLRELKQKQRLRELEAAQTPEQKQEVFKLLQKESVPVEENPNDYLLKLINGLTQDEKYTSFFNIRKGKVLLLRVLPHLTNETYGTHLLDLWIKILLSVPIIGRRDAAGDNLLPKLHPFFKRFVQMCTMSDVLDVVTNISEVIKPDQNSRSTPLSHQGKAPLNFIIGNKFGISTLATMIVRTEYLISSENAVDKQKLVWFGFLTNLADLVSSAPNVAQPVELVPAQIFKKHCNRVASMPPEKRVLLESKIVDAN